MTAEDQRIAIAEACEWTHIKESGRLDGQLIGWRPDGLMKYYELPDYLSDLNAMHSAEKVLTDMQWHRYLQELARIVREKGQAEVRISQYVRATAAQRSEAFLRTLGKWTE